MNGRIVGSMKAKGENMGVNERKEREKEQRRNDIIDAAEEIFFSKDINEAKMDEVAKKAELSKGTLYLYFKNKDELLHGIIARGIRILLKMFQKAMKKEKTGLNKIIALGNTYQLFFKTQPNYFSAMLHKEIKRSDPEKIKTSPNYAECETLGNQIFTLMQEAVELGMKDGTIRNDLDAKKLPLVLWAHSSGTLHILKSKEEMVTQMLHQNPEDIMKYSQELIISYLKK